MHKNGVFKSDNISFEVQEDFNDATLIKANLVYRGWGQLLTYYQM